MVNTKLNLSMTEPYVRQIYAKEGDTGRVLEIGLEDYPTENGTLRILRPDGVEVTAEAIKSAGGDAYKGDLVTFDALEEVPLTKCEVTLEPIQDLHGQSSPYPSGGGVNILDPSARTQYSASGLRWWESDGYTLKANQPYTFKYFQITDESCALYIRRKSDGETIAQQSLTLTYTPTEDVLVYLQAYRTNISTDENRFIFVKGTTAPTSWSPYSNICPITGHDEVMVTRTGKNLVTSVENALLSGTADGGALYQLNASCRSLIFECKEGQTYTVSGVTNNRFAYGFYDSMPSANEKTTSFVSGSGSLPKTFTALKDGVCVVYLSNVAVDTSTAQVELGSTATTYEPYNGTTYPLSLGQNVYGGKVDLVSGKLVVNRVIDTLTKDSAWYSFATGTGNSSAVVQLSNYQNVKYVDSVSAHNGAISSTGKEAPNYWISARQNEVPTEGDMCFAYSSGGQIRFHRVDVANITDLASFKTNFPDTQVVYYLATPTVIDLTPTQISTLLGENNVWSSGTVEVAFEYDGLFAQLPEEATEVVGRCLGDVDFNGASTMPFTLVVKPNNKEQA